MADITQQGYLITVDSTTIVNHTTLKARNVIQNTATANIRTYTLPTGVKVDYDGSSDVGVTPGTMTQEIVATTGGIALYWTLAAKIGDYVTSVFSPLSGADLTNTSTRIVSVDDVTPGLKRSDEVHISITIDIVGTWA